MAYDGYQQNPNQYPPAENSNPPINLNEVPPSQFAPPYPVQYSPDQVNMPQPQIPSQASAPAQNQYPDPFREQNRWPPPQPPHGGVNEAAASAANNAGPSNSISQELLTQITATVIQQLRAASLDNLPSNPRLAPQPPPQWDPSTPHYAQTSSMPPGSAIPLSTSPPPLRTAPDTTTYPSSSISPEPLGGSHLYRKLSPTPPQERRESPISHVSDNSQKAGPRPRPPVRGDTFGNTLERIWGKLFEDGNPTERLGQFLRGVAQHLIEDYPPKNSLVVVPEKLQKFYADTNLSSDPYPWQDVFDDRTSSISRLFREIEAEHHLVQGKLDERPDIPGLTPRGFQKWATLMIQAHPEKEYERLQKALLNMPISNPDNSKERFPKDIPRRLFPEVPDLVLREKIDQFIMKHCGVDLPPITEEEIKKVAAYRRKASTSPVPAKAEPIPSINDSGRKSHQHSTSAIIDDDEDDEDEGPGPSHPIERKRKPYSAQPGGGKVYEGPESPAHRHSNSFSADSKDARVHVSGSPIFRNASLRRSAARSRSQSRGFAPGHEYRHSESDLFTGNGGSRTPGVSSGGDYYYEAPTSAPLPADLADDARKYREVDRSAEDQRLYESLREREKEREKSKYGDHLPHRPGWADDEDYYRGLLGGQGSTDYKGYR